MRAAGTACGAVTASIGASGGIAVSRAGDTSSTILRRADLAMYEAKYTLQSRAAVFADEMAARAERRHLLTQALPGAAERGELAVVYQPLIRLQDGAVAGVQALLRWSSPLHGQVPPLEFIPLAEETGAIMELGGWVLDQATQHVSDWAAAGRRLPRLLVNVSSRQLTSGFVAQAVRLDREFIRGVCTDDGRRIVEAIVALAGDLGMTTVAEGVGSEAEAVVLRQAGCALGQGYHFATPLTATTLWPMLPEALAAPQEDQRAGRLP